MDNSRDELGRAFGDLGKTIKKMDDRDKNSASNKITESRRKNVFANAEDHNFLIKNPLNAKLGKDHPAWSEGFDKNGLKIGSRAHGRHVLAEARKKEDAAAKAIDEEASEAAKKKGGILGLFKKS